MIVLEIFLMGLFATLFMDLSTGFLVKRKIVHSPIEPELIGRWFLSMFRGKFIHEDISRTPGLNNERSWCLVSHYLIGVALAGVYLFLTLAVPALGERFWAPLAFGIATVVLPWLWLFPSMGLGFFAAKSPDRSLILKANIVNHTNFGLGFLVWMLLGHDLFV